MSGPGQPVAGPAARPSEPALEAIATSSVGPLAPNFRIRVLQFAAGLREGGVELDARAFLSQEQAAEFSRASVWRRGQLIGNAGRRQRLWLRQSTATVALVSRQADLAPTLALEKAVADQRRLVYDVDDAIWLAGDSAAGGHRFAFLKASGRKAAFLANRADVTLAGNDTLAEWLEPHANELLVVPSVVDPTRISRREHGDADELVVGWIGSPSTARYVRRIVGAVSAAAREIRPRRLRFLMIGAPGIPIPGVVTEARQWSELEESDALKRMDVGVMPLPDDPWTRAKSAYKALQYMAAAVPVVADPVGVAPRVLDDGGAGLLPRGGSAWTEALVSLLNDPLERTQLGEGGELAWRIITRFSAGGPPSFGSSGRQPDVRDCWVRAR